MLRKTLLGSAAPLLMSAALAPVHAWGAESVAAPPTARPTESQANVASVQEVVVTAEKRESTVQRTAATVSVVNSTVLMRQQIVDLKDLNAVLPNVQIVPVVNSLQITIRGIGSDFIDPRADPGAAASLNGLYFDRPLPNGFAFLDVSRVEVLAGPQGTLYGRNAAAGAINIITNQPTNHFEGYIEGTVGSLDDNDLTAVVNVPLGDDLAVRAAYARDRRDGYLGGYYDDVHDDTSRVSALWRPSDRLSVFLESDYLQTGGHGQANEAWPCTGAQPWSLVVPANCPSTHKGATEPTTGQLGTFVWANQLDVNYDLGWATLTSITGYIGTHQRFWNEPNGVLFNATELANNDDYSEEIRLTGRETASHQGGLQWQAGAYFFTSSGNYYYAKPGFGLPFTFSSLPQRSEAGFAQVTYGVTDRLRITAGARFTQDFKGLVGSGGAISAQGDKWTYKAGLEYDLAPSHLLYGNVSTGYVAGGPNGGVAALPTPPNLAPPTFQPETVTAYEIGSKNRFLDSRLQLNVSAYYYDFRDYQVTEPAFLNGPGEQHSGSQILVIENAGAVKTYGVEADGEFALTANDRLSASLLWAHGTFGALHLATIAGNPVTGFTPLAIDLAGGTPLVNLPGWTAQLGYAHTWDVGDDAHVVASINSKLSTAYALVVGSVGDPFDTQPGYTMTDAALSYDWDAARYSIRGWVKNIENAPVNTYGQAPGMHNYSILAPRTYGVTLTAKF
jgi:iron complex outermembrane receptor protein